MTDVPAHTYWYTHSQSHLLYDVDAVVDLLPLQEGVQVVQQGPQVGLPVPVRDHDGRVVAGLAVRGAVVTPRGHQGVPPSDLLKRQRGRQVDRHGTH